MFKRQPKEPIVEGTRFGWVIHGREENAESKSMFVKGSSDYMKLYSLDVLGAEDRVEDDQSSVYSDFQENITRREDDDITKRGVDSWKRVEHDERANQ